MLSSTGNFSVSPLPNSLSGREIVLAIIKVEEHVVEPDKEFGSGDTEKFPVDDNIDWETEPEDQGNQNNQ